MTRIFIDFKGFMGFPSQFFIIIPTMKKEWKIKDSGKNMGKITLSMGIAQYKFNEPEKALIKRADDALYFAKQNGRNQMITQEMLEAKA